jgi:hypothetical protein
VRADRRGLVGVWTIAILIILGTGNTAFASAWHGVNRFEVAGISSTFPVHPPQTAKRGRIRTVAHHIAVQKRSRFVRDARSLRASPISIWPFSLPLFMFPIAIPTSPIVVVLSEFPRNASGPTISETLLDYDYVPGCRAIRNGYHCDSPHGETTH